MTAIEIIREECCAKCKAKICETCNVGKAIQRIQRVGSVGDSISRQAAIDEIQPFGEYESNKTNKEWVRLFTIVLKQLPSVDCWIPCSERLPEIEHGGQRRGWYLTTDDYECVNITQYEFHCSFLKTGWQSDTQILAWMPLPEPYKGATQNDD